MPPRPLSHASSASRPPPVPLRALLLACVAYFVAMSGAHWTGFKVPLLFIFYDVPSNTYQDRIISFCALTYALLFAAAASHAAVVPHALASLGVTVAGLVGVACSLPSGEPGPHHAAHGVQIAGLAGLLLLLLLLRRGG